MKTLFQGSTPSSEENCHLTTEGAGMFRVLIPWVSAFFCVGSACSPQIPQLPFQTHAFGDGWTGSVKLSLGRKSVDDYWCHLCADSGTCPGSWIHSHHDPIMGRLVEDGCPSSVSIAYITTFFFLFRANNIQYFYNAPTTIVLLMFLTGKVVWRDPRSTTYSVPSGYFV